MLRWMSDSRSFMWRLGLIVQEKITGMKCCLIVQSPAKACHEGGMDKFIELLQNPWVVGIGGGIVSGALVAWLTHLVLAKGENKEYRGKVNNANREVIYAIRPGISEGNIPTVEVINSLVMATARRNSVSSDDMY